LAIDGILLFAFLMPFHAAGEQTVVVDCFLLGKADEAIAIHVAAMNLALIFEYSPDSNFPYICAHFVKAHVFSPLPAILNSAVAVAGTGSAA
jgi:hypothetical protein